MKCSQSAILPVWVFQHCAHLFAHCHIAKVRKRDISARVRLYQLHHDVESSTTFPPLSLHSSLSYNASVSSLSAHYLPLVDSQNQYVQIHTFFHHSSLLLISSTTQKLCLKENPRLPIFADHNILTPSSKKLLSGPI